MKESMLHVRVDERDRERLARLAAHLELTESAVVRRLIKEAADALPTVTTPKKKTSPKKRGSLT